jgi:hypothetical protein
MARALLPLALLGAQTAPAGIFGPKGERPDEKKANVRKARIQEAVNEVLKGVRIER